MKLAPDVSDRFGVWQWYMSARAIANQIRIYREFSLEAPFDMTDDKLLMDEARRSANYEALKSSVESEVAGDVAARARVQATPEVAAVADELRTRAADELITAEQDVQRGRVAARVSQIVDYIFFLIYASLAIRLLLELFAARESAAFFKFVKAVTDPFYWPFRGIVPSPSTPNGFSLELSIVVALFVYAILHVAINGILRIMAHRKVQV